MAYKRILIPILLFLFPIIMIFSEVANKDKPQHGDWDFKLEKVWEIGRVGDGIVTVRFTYRKNIIRLFGAGYWRKGKAVYEKESKIHR